MNRKVRTTLALLAMAMIAVLVLGAQAQARSAETFTLTTKNSPFLPGVQTMGWWDATGVREDIDNDNYIVGEFFGTRARNFFTFDGAHAPSGCATSAALKIPAGTGSGDFGGVDTIATYVLRDVLTNPHTLNTTTGPNLGIYNDLGTGTQYARINWPTFGYPPTTVVTVPLNSAALAAINAAIASDRRFSFGGMIVHEPVGVALFGFTPVTHGHDLPVKLELNLESC